MSDKFICYGCRSELSPSAPPCRMEASGIEPHLDGGGFCPSDGKPAMWQIVEDEEQDDE